MEIIGTLKLIKPTEQVKDTFKKREVVITTEDQYPQDILVEFVQDKTDLLNNFKKGDKATISINLRGREWINPQGEAKYFNSIQGWRIAKNENTVSNIPPVEQNKPANVESEEPDDLPF